MHNCEATLDINQQPVLPFSSPPRFRKLKEVASAPIGRKIRSFQIQKSRSPSAQREKSVNTVKLPNFTYTYDNPNRATALEASMAFDLPSSSLDVFTNRLIAKSIDLYQEFSSGRTCNNQSYWVKQDRNQVHQLKSYSSPSTKRFWWHWVLLVGSTILLLPFFLQPSSQARNLLERARIYLELDAEQAVTIPDSGRTHLQKSQASYFNRAIREAREIKPNSPFYQEAKADIIRWSEIILDIAQGRAEQGDFANAIAAASLIPQDETSVNFIAQQASEAIDHWQLRAQTQYTQSVALARAKSLINPTQASSYNQAIRILRQSSLGGKEYQEAQNLIEQWSRQIYLIANHRAAQGDFERAIAAVALVPKDSPYYEGARNAMIKWKQFSPIGYSRQKPKVIEARVQEYCDCPSEDWEK